MGKPSINYFSNSLFCNWCFSQLRRILHLGTCQMYALSIELLMLGKGQLWFGVFAFQIVGSGNLINRPSCKRNRVIILLFLNFYPDVQGWLLKLERCMRMKMFCICAVQQGTTSHVRLLSTWNAAASAIEELYFRFYFISNNLRRDVLDSASLALRPVHHWCKCPCDSSADLVKLQILVW